MQEREQVIEGYRLSPQQRRVWQLQQDSQAYKAQCAILIEGDLDSKALEEALKKIVRKHEILRTTLDWIPGQSTPIQVILKNPSLPWRTVDLSDRKPKSLDIVVDDLFREEARPFELKRGLLLRYCLGRLSRSKQVLLVSLHSLLADSWTLKNLFKEIRRFYAAEVEGRETPDDPVQYLQFSEWQNELLNENKEEAGNRHQAAHNSAPIYLPLESDLDGRWDSSQLQFSPGASALTLDAQMTRCIESVSNAYGFSISGFLLACWQILLWRLCAEEEIITECLFDGREFEELHDALGLFAGYVPARGTLVCGLRFDEAVERAMRSLQSAFASQEFFLRDMADKQVMDRTHAISFDFEKWPRGGRVGPVKFSYWKQYVCIDRFKLKLCGYRKVNGLTIEIQYDTSIFSRESVELIQERFLTLVESAISNERALIEDISILGQKEREGLLVAWNNTEKKLPDSRCVHELISEQARLRPDAIAVIYKQEQLSYLELERRANQMANHLKSLGVGLDCVVGLYMERSLEIMIGLLGVLKAGGAYLPLEVGQPVERLEHMLEDSEAKIILTKQDVIEGLPTRRPETVILDRDWTRIAGCGHTAPEVEVKPENLAYVIYTSGSTGRPKGVLITHEGLTNSTYARFMRYSDSVSGFLLVSPFSFDSSVAGIYWTLCQGGMIVLPYEGLERDPSRLAGLVAENGISHLLCLPTLYSLLLTVADPRRMDSLKCVIVAGEVCPVEVIVRHTELFAGAKIFNEYGPTEGTVWSSVHGDCSKQFNAPVPIGKPIANVQIYILDEKLELALTGGRGEIYISGTNLARGYLGKPELTAGRFIPNPFSAKEGAKLYRTGDIGKYLTNGDIEFIGRVDGQVKVRGRRIELGEIEEALNKHRSVRQSVVIVREDEKRDKRLIGYVVLEEEITVAALKSYLKEKLPEYMVPDAILILGAMPITVSGKIDRQRLPALLDARQLMEEGFVAPRDPLEFKLAQIWESVIGVRPIGVKDDFFNLGGHSLLAPSLMARIKNVIGRDLPLSVLFQGRTVEYLAAILRREANSISWSCLVELQVSGSQPPLFFAHPGGGNVLCYLDLARCLGSDQPFYGLQTPGFYEERILYTRIEDMASHYLEAVQAVRPEGPYFLGGWSLGGIIAYEMAQQLVARGQRDIQLLLLDTAAWTSGEEFMETEIDDAELLRGIFSETLPITSEDLEQFEGDERIDYVLKAAISANLFPPGIEVVRVRSFLDMYKTNVRAMANYAPQPYPGSVTLFNAPNQITAHSGDESIHDERLTRMLQDATRGWGALAAGGAQIIDVPGTHTTMLMKPHVETLALRIKECLNTKPFDLICS